MPAVVRQKDSHRPSRDVPVFVPASHCSVVLAIQKGFDIVDQELLQCHVVKEYSLASGEKKALHSVQAVHEEVLAKGSQNGLGYLRFARPSPQMIKLFLSTQFSSKSQFLAAG